MKKTKVWMRVLGIIAIVAIIGFSFAACTNNCDTCDGTGKIDCIECGGTGTIQDVTCPWGGDGKRPCPDCDGTGEK